MSLNFYWHYSNYNAWHWSSLYARSIDTYLISTRRLFIDTRCLLTFVVYYFRRYRYLRYRYSNHSHCRYRYRHSVAIATVDNNTCIKTIDTGYIATYWHYRYSHLLTLCIYCHHWHWRYCHLLTLCRLPPIPYCCSHARPAVRVGSKDVDRGGQAFPGCQVWLQSGSDWPQKWQIWDFFRSDFSTF